MSNLAKIQEGATVLQQVDVSDIFTSLAKGIADAQKRLDDNSIAQLTKMVETKLGDKSLLELGFAPSFYSFTYADISASIQLKMEVKDDFTLGADLTFTLSKTKGYTELESRFISETRYTSLLQEYKSSKEFSFRIKQSNSITVENENYNYEKKEDVKKELRSYREKLVEQEAIDFSIQEINAKQITVKELKGIHAWMDSGFLRIEQRIDFDKNTVGILRIDELKNTPEEFDLNGDSVEFGNDEDFKEVLKNARTANGNGEIFGISSSGKFYEYDSSADFREIPSDLYFKFNDSEILYGTSLQYQSETNLITASANNGKTTENHSDHAKIHRVLRFINEFDPNTSFTITGYTDPIGKKETNEILARKRANSMKSHIFNDGNKVNIQIKEVTNQNGGTSNLALRKASIKLSNDSRNYIIFMNGNITSDATPPKTSSAKNKFIYLKDYASPIDKYTLDISYGQDSIQILNVDTKEEIITEILKKNFSYSKENTHEREYLIHDEAIVKHTVFSSTRDTIKLEDKTTTTTSEKESENSTVISNDITSATHSLSQFKDKNGTNTVAMSANVDFRTTKQFEMEVTGNSSMSARMVAIPPPEEFKAYIRTLFNLDSD